MEKKLHQGAPLHQMLNVYRPYAYIFIILFILTALPVFIYLATTLPMFESFASILIKDERRGQVDSKMEEMLDLFNGKNIVENEVEVLKSNALLQEVAINLRLYSTIWENDGWGGHRILPGYHTSPFNAEIEDPRSIQRSFRIPFEVLDQETVLVSGKKMGVGKWFRVNSLNIRFVANPAYWKDEAVEGRIFFVQLMPLVKAVQQISSRLMVGPASKQASVILLRVRDELPDRGERILNELVQVYALSSVRKKQEAALQTLRFIESRLDKVTMELDSVEVGIEQYRKSNGLVDLSEQSSQYLRSVELHDLELTRMKMQLAIIDEVEGNLRSGNGSVMAPSTSVLGDPGLSQMLERLAIREQEKERVRKTTAENNPILTSIDSEISRIKSSILENLASLRRNIEVGQQYLTGVSGKYTTMLRNIPKKEKELIEVSRQRSIKSGIYSFLLQKKEETMFALKSTVSDHQLVEYPSSGNEPVSPKIPFLVAFTLVVPIITGVGGVTLMEYLNGRILYRKDIESLTTVPVIGEIAFDRSEGEILTSVRRRSFVQEQFRQLRAAYRHLEGGMEKYNRVMVTSCVEGDGKSFVASNFAIGLAKSGKRVALIGLDLYQPKLHELFQVESSPGISEWLQQSCKLSDMLRPTSIPDLVVIPAGTGVDNPCELLSDSRLNRLLDTLATRFDVLVVDAPPVRPVTDAWEIGQACNLVLFVVRHNHTPKTGLQLLDDKLTQHKIQKACIVFNGVKRRGVGKYSYGFGYGYGYDDRMSYATYGQRKKQQV
jgi:capsular exopolysaccharide synthesis family protein